MVVIGGLRVLQANAARAAMAVVLAKPKAAPRGRRDRTDILEMRPASPPTMPIPAASTRTRIVRAARARPAMARAATAPVDRSRAATVRSMPTARVVHAPAAATAVRVAVVVVGLRVATAET